MFSLKILKIWEEQHLKYETNGKADLRKKSGIAIKYVK